MRIRLQRRYSRLSLKYGRRSKRGAHSEHPRNRTGRQWVVIDSKGHILTIGYLIVEADTIEVVGPEDKPVKATFVGYDHSTGFGLLKTDKPLAVPPMKLGKSSTVKEGDPVIVGGMEGRTLFRLSRSSAVRNLQAIGSISSTMPFLHFPLIQFCRSSPDKP